MSRAGCMIHRMSLRLVLIRQYVDEILVSGARLEPASKVYYVGFSSVLVVSNDTSCQLSKTESISTS